MRALSVRGSPLMSTRRYSPTVARQFCARLAEGESLAAICSDPAMPGKADILDWLCARANFRERYARARELQTHILLEEILEIGDEKGADGEAGAGDPIQSAKLRIDTRKDLNSSIRWLRDPAEHGQMRLRD
jgi:hypothetical protein